MFCFFFSSRRRHTRFDCDWSSDVCSSDLERDGDLAAATSAARQAVAFDLDDEPALARLIELLDRSGDRAGALNAFETFRRGLLRQYDATPSPETDARIQAIRARQTPFVAAAPRPGPVTTPLIPAH